ncbi:MAG: Clp protease ClpP [Gammaproteobacteria bacterium]|uniref:Putative protease n=1 Tax=viral metagenome TaxID=1070528 RepID=A0A6M3JAC6_9ZZZZ|nr:Clp protease ClpP [Gammaproteobacteria bacterium]MBU1492229.1 Clp protease ClpP [Gammaproteobacteria bacterium]MBU2066800.1 Clp protease ClpP [Gammaproteobacteria bacterium]MBU2137384.1 Clp protease ClpP [Gammaproteobacteria bacterium]MBU2215055.1 Clp protease ClpP [Gammaproteobacteria bacterium]
MKKMTNRLALAVMLGGLGINTFAQPRMLNLEGAPDLNAEHWYSIHAAGEEAGKPIEVYIYGEIGFWGVTSGDFIRDLKEVDDGVSEVLVHFDTVGGDLFDGVAIHNTLRALGERCTGQIDGACFSAGSVAVCGAHKVRMADNAMFMIHNPWTFMAGDSEELRKMADMMDKASEGIVASYQHRALNIEDAELRRMINDTTWLTASEAKTHGFVDEVFGEVAPLVNNAALGKILNRYRNVPEAALRLVGEVEQPPEPAPEPGPVPTPEPDPEPTAPAATELAAKLAADCEQAGLSNCLPYLIRASALASSDAVQAHFTRAKEVRAACLVAKLPDDAQGLIEAGYSGDQARAKLFDKLAASSGKVEISNLPPLDDGPQANAHQPPAPSEVYARRRNTQASKGGKQA